MPFAPTPDDIAAARQALVAADPALVRVDAQTPPLEWRLRVGGFEGLFRMIVEQQVSVASAASVWARLREGMGGITPELLLAHDLDQLRGMGLSRQKATYGQGIARAQIAGEIDLEHLANLDDEAAIASLTALKGVGLWTAEAYLMMCEGRLDVFPGGDVALQEAIRWADGAEVRPDQKGAYARAEIWRPYRAVATHLLWAWYTGVKRGEIALDAPA
ncbi:MULTISPECIES: DNA-3-methyladenine glycosylase [unclassified Brevundimonas]|jgi:DNA-3-methyladenine glycosylase II|uniref:DNA-3-methyladenine glycosylase family protein n=1 Tax=unclassified Brevundimonas TaxID=2622653 RepID=UPI00129D9EB7|nr:MULTISPECIES: DNA-3-methyladenine glycosylase [unclassified Brevundimonas]MCW0047366.1 DNA-3-methyladenine glycosylase [Brevundimonas sp. BT-123]MRL68192.1 DNA-3-methyladenine glycosylase 2 family protein [Brevundimonas sp. SPF441]